MNVIELARTARVHNWTVNPHSTNEWVSLSRGQVSIYVWFTGNGRISHAQRWDNGVEGDVFAGDQKGCATHIYYQDKGKAATLDCWLATTADEDIATAERINIANGRGPALAEVGDDDFQTWKADAADQVMTTTTQAGTPIDPEVLRVLVETVSYWHGKLDHPQLIQTGVLQFLTDASHNLHAYLTR